MKFEIYANPPPLGVFIYSSSGCGDDSAIRIEVTDDIDKPFDIGLSPEQARKIGKLLIDTAINYENGIETGIYFQGKQYE